MSFRPWATRRATILDIDSVLREGQAREEIGAYIECYYDRPHGGLNSRTPREVAAPWQESRITIKVDVLTCQLGAVQATTKSLARSEPYNLQAITFGIEVVAGRAGCRTARRVMIRFHRDGVTTRGWQCEDATTDLNPPYFAFCSRGKVLTGVFDPT